MSLTLSYGFTKPETNDEGPDLFPLLEDNWQQVNDHTHNGVNSAKLPGSSIQSVTATILAANFTVIAGKTGHYQQTVTLPVGFSYDTTKIEFQLASSGHRVMAGIEKVSATQYKVLLSSNTDDLLVRYG